MTPTQKYYGYFFLISSEMEAEVSRRETFTLWRRITRILSTPTSYDKQKNDVRDHFIGM
jgi:hypothetical protein